MDAGASANLLINCQTARLGCMFYSSFDSSDRWFEMRRLMSSLEIRRLCNYAAQSIFSLHIHTGATVRTPRSVRAALDFSAGVPGPVHAAIERISPLPNRSCSQQPSMQPHRAIEPEQHRQQW